MKIQLFLALLVGQTVAAPLGGSIDGSLSASPGDATGALKIKASGPSEPTIEEKVKGFEAVLYLFAPENWVSSWNDVSNEGKQCFLSRAADPANAEIYQSEDSTKMKDDLKAKCSSSYDQLIKFANQTEDTMKALPESFLSISKAWGQQMQTLGNQFKSAAKSTADSAKSTADAAKTGADAAGNQIANAASSGAAKASDAWKGAVSQFAKPTSEYLAKLSAMSQEDRQKLSAAFPKLEPFFSGDHAVEFLNEVTNIYKTIGSGDFNPTSLQPEAQKLATTWSTLWDQYKTKNTDGLKKAGDIWKKDLIQAGDAFSASLASQVNGNWNNMAPAGSPAVGTLPGSPSAVPVAGLPSGISGSATGGVDASVPGASASSSFVSKLSEKNPDLADTIKKRVEEGKEKLNETKEKVKEGLNKAGESAKTGFENAKQTLNKAGENAKEGLKDARENLKEAFNDFKENAKDFKEKHLNFPSESASGTVNANGNDASAGFRLNN